MLPEPVPDRGPDDEPDGSLLPDADWDGPEQGLFVCLPAEELTLEGFAEDGRADTMAPGPLLAAVVGAVAGDDARGLKGTSDDQLAGIISASLRLESRAAWTRLAALAEYASRRPAGRDQGIRATGAPAPGPDGISVFAADELTWVLNRTWQPIAGELSYAHARRRSRSAGPAPCHGHPAAHAGTASIIIRVPVPSSGNYRGGSGFRG